MDKLSGSVFDFVSQRMVELLGIPLAEAREYVEQSRKECLSIGINFGWSLPVGQVKRNAIKLCFIFALEKCALSYGFCDREFVGVWEEDLFGGEL